MNKLIADNPANSSITELFSKLIPSENRLFLNDSVVLDYVDDLKMKGNKFAYKKDNGKIGAQLLLLLAYMTVSTVLDDTSMETQM